MRLTILSTLFFALLILPSFTENLDGKSFPPADPSSTALVSNPGDPPFGIQREFSTDFSRSAVHYETIFSGGPPKDGIPSIDAPVFVSVQKADEWMGDSEPVLVLRFQDTVRVYPLQILMWHEIVNDTLNGIPVAVSYCPLCNTGIVFESLIDGRALQFGTTGRLRFGNLIMYDRQTETWWQQASGEGIVGMYAGRQLKFLPVTILPWREIMKGNQDAQVLSRKTGYSRPYGENPYQGYDTGDTPFLYRGPEIAEEYNPFERLLVVRVDGQEKAYAFSRLREEKVIQETLAGRKIVIFYQSGASSALDTRRIEDGRDTGTAQAYFPHIGGRGLFFYHDGMNIRDQETGSIWDIGGTAIRGKLKNTRLDSPVTINHFWFSWSAFQK